MDYLILDPEATDTLILDPAADFFLILDVTTPVDGSLIFVAVGIGIWGVHAGDVGNFGAVQCDSFSFGLKGDVGELMSAVDVGPKMGVG